MADDSLTGASKPAASAAGRTTRGAAKAPARRGGIGLFLRQIIDELRKVVRPTRAEWVTYTTVVITFVVAIMLFVFALDNLFTRLVSWAFAGTL